MDLRSLKKVLGRNLKDISKDLVPIILIPVVLCIIPTYGGNPHMDQFMLNYSSPNGLTFFTTNFIHDNSTHLSNNLFMYGEVIILMYLLAFVSGQRGKFYKILIPSILLFPWIISSLDFLSRAAVTALPICSRDFMAGWGKGFSGINSVFLGFLPHMFLGFLDSLKKKSIGDLDISHYLILLSGLIFAFFATFVYVFCIGSDNLALIVILPIVITITCLSYVILHSMSDMIRGPGFEYVEQLLGRKPEDREIISYTVMLMALFIFFVAIYIGWITRSFPSNEVDLKILPHYYGWVLGFAGLPLLLKLKQSITTKSSEREIKMENKDSLEALKLFNEKAEKLEECSFTRIVLEEGSGISGSAKKGGDFIIERRGPNEEAIDAFVLTFRFFIQNNERSSFENIAEIYDELPISREKKESFEVARKDLNDFLDSESTIKPQNQTVTHRYVLDVFIYGGLSHANKTKKQIFDRWMAHPIIKTIMINELVYALGSMIKFIRHVRGLNDKLINELQ